MIRLSIHYEGSTRGADEVRRVLAELLESHDAASVSIKRVPSLDESSRLLLRKTADALGQAAKRAKARVEQEAGE